MKSALKSLENYRNSGYFDATHFLLCLCSGSRVIAAPAISQARLCCSSAVHGAFPHGQEQAERGPCFEVARAEAGWGHRSSRGIPTAALVTRLCRVSERGTGWSLQATEMGLRLRTCRRSTRVPANPERCPGHLLECSVEDNITAEVGEELGSALGEAERQRNPEWDSDLHLRHLFNVVASPAFQQNI